MNIIIDIISNSIILARPFSKKKEPFFKAIHIEYPLDKPLNQQRALNEAITLDVAANLKLEKSNSLIISDDLVAFGLEELPVLSKAKVADVFDTRFKMYFPNFNDYFVDAVEFERNNEKVNYFYTISRRDNVNKLIDILRKKEVEIKNINYFSLTYATRFNANNEFPSATLLIGDNISEIFISKGNVVYGVSLLPMGKKQLFEKEKYLSSAYNISNMESLRFASCVKANFAANLSLTDEKILSYDEDGALQFSIPREARIIKGASLETYNIKNNFRKFTAMVGDVLESYASAPWFIPVNEVNVHGLNDNFDNLLLSAENDVSFKYIKSENNLEDLYKTNFENNKLFNQEFKKEKKRIDWAKFFTMEIGKKKKGLTVLETVIALTVIVIVSIAAVSIAISTSNSFNSINVKRFFQREIDNISEIYLTYDETNFKKGFKDLTGQDITGHNDKTYYLDDSFNYVNSESEYKYKLILDFDTNSLEVKATKADDSILTSRSVSKYEA